MLVVQPVCPPESASSSKHLARLPHEHRCLRPGCLDQLTHPLGDTFPYLYVAGLRPGKLSSVTDLLICDSVHYIMSMAHSIFYTAKAPRAPGPQAGCRIREGQLGCGPMGLKTRNWPGNMGSRLCLRVLETLEAKCRGARWIETAPDARSAAVPWRGEEGRA